MSKNIVYEGWLTKSPPTKRIWRTKWRRRWFALRQSGELPGQYFLDYYADRNCRRLKGTINLDLCEQVDAGLHMERTGHGSIDPNLRGSVFTIQTQSRTYHLEADCEADMEKWVDAICKVCGLRATDEPAVEMVQYQNNMTPMAAMDVHYQRAVDGTGPYIPISECITGVRAQDEQRTFTFDPNNLVINTRTPLDRVSDNRARRVYVSQPQIRINELFEDDSNMSDEECKSLNASQSNIQDWSVAKSFTKLAINPKRNGLSEDGPPVPPRPPKTLAMTNTMKETVCYQGPKIQEPVESQENVSPHPWYRQKSQGGSSPPRSLYPLSYARTTDDEDECNPVHDYYNMPSLPPAVDRALKPRHSSHSIGHIKGFYGQGGLRIYRDGMKEDALQYLDLDLPTSKPSPNKPQALPRRQWDISHGKSYSDVDSESAYKTVDFLKTEAFNITRQDAEAFRLTHQ